MSTTVSDPLVGRLLDRRYQVEARIAAGGMATVYTARDTRLDRTVALKVMHDNLAKDDTFVSRFIREARSAARLSQPNVVSVYDQGDDDGTVFLAMEYVPGRTLREVLRERGRLQPREALEVLQRVLSALAAAHEAGLVHRDVKPENVLISDEGRVKVADFGLARAISASSHTKTTGIIIGTVAYLAPEQVTQGTADARSDVYAAGILLYEMLVGHVPFRAETPLAVAYKHVHEDVPPPSEQVQVPAQLDELVALATSRDPARRPEDAADFLADVTACRRELPDLGDALPAAPRPVSDEGNTLVIGREPLPPTPAPLPAPTDDLVSPEPLSPEARKKRRRRGALALTLVLLLALLAGGGGWWFGMGRYTETPDLVGMQAVKAESRAKADGFGMTEQTAYHETAPKGEVISTKPGPGDRMLRGGTITMVVSRGPERHEVPKLVGKSESDAKAALVAGKLAVGEVTHKYSSTVDEGDVISTSPKAGKDLKRNAKVDLVVSKGIPPVTVPTVTGISRAAAEKKLENAGLKANVTEQEHKTVAKGDVISQSPGAGAKRAKGATVTIAVSTGPPLVEVPSVTGMASKDARKKLKAAGFKAKEVGFPGGRGTVIRQSPTAGTKARYGTTVQLLVF